LIGAIVGMGLFAGAKAVMLTVADLSAVVRDRHFPGPCRQFHQA